LINSVNSDSDNYFYDASGERTVKESGDNEGVTVNGIQSAGRSGTTNFTAYISPYLVVSNGGNYTKHIYMGGQRITSKVSNSGIFTASPVTTIDLQAKYIAQTAKIKERFDSLRVTYKGTPQSGGLVSKDTSTPTGSYFYHSDHLGSSSLITDASGAIVQHLEYVPFGETFIDERRSQSSWTTPYLFSGKERDEETGLLYFGARYQDSKYGIWYSVDPLAEKFAGRSSYEYCLSNPVAYIDHDGRFSQKWMANLSRNWYNLWNKEKAGEIVENKDATKSQFKYTYQSSKTINGEVEITSHYKFDKKGAQNMQNVGDGAALVGLGLTLSVVGAEVGAPLAAAGGIFSGVGSAWEAGVDFLNGDMGDFTKKAGFYVGGKLIEKGINKVLPGGGKTLYEDGFDLGTEILTQGTKFTSSGIERVVDAKLEKDNKRKNK